MYLQEWNNCVRNHGESVYDYGDRLSELYLHIVPLEDYSDVEPASLRDHLNQRQQMARDQAVRDQFIKGFTPVGLKIQLQYSKVESFAEFLREANELAIIKDGENKPKVQYVDSIEPSTTY